MHPFKVRWKSSGSFLPLALNTMSCVLFVLIFYTVFQKRLHRPTFDKIDMAYIKTSCPNSNRDIVEVLKSQH